MVPVDFDAGKEHGHDVGDEDEGGGGTDGRHSDFAMALGTFISYSFAFFTCS